MMTEVRGMVGHLRESHHRIAQMYAMGMTDSMIRRMTGLTQLRLRLYRNDPAFQNLVAELQKECDEKMEDAIELTQQLMIHNRTMGEIAIAEAIQEHLDGEREIQLSVLDKIVQGRMDRTGYGKTQKVEHKHDFAIRLEAAIERSSKVVEGREIEGQVLDRTPPSVLAPSQAPAPLPAPSPAAVPEPAAALPQSEPPSPALPPTGAPNLSKVLNGGYRLQRRRLA